VPQLEETVEKKDRMLRQAQSQIEAQQARILKLEGEVKSLQTECDKLRSVLSQKAESNVATPPASKTSQAEELHTDLQTVSFRRDLLSFPVGSTLTRSSFFSRSILTLINPLINSSCAVTEGHSPRNRSS
jgi:septal ring factor EnvC (AmiA/AmiB activator)